MGPTCRRTPALVVIAFVTLPGVARADFTPTLDGNVGEWAPFAKHNDGGEGPVPNYRDIGKIWVNDNNTAGSNGYLFFGLEFFANVGPTTSPNHLSVIEIAIDTNLDGATDYVARINRDAGTFQLLNGAGVVLHTYVYGTDYKDVNGKDAELRIPYADLGLVFGADTLTFVVRTDPTSPTSDRGPDTGTLFFNGPANNGPGVNVRPTAAEVGVVLATARATGVEVAWQVAAEIDNVGFRVLRWRPIEGWREIARRSGRGTSGLAAIHTSIDEGGRIGDWYAIADVDSQGVQVIRAATLAARVPLGRIVGSISGSGSGSGTRERERARERERSDSAFSPQLRPLTLGRAVKISVTTGGLVRVPRADLAAAGSLWAAPTPPRLTFFGTAVPAWASPAGDLLFYARAPEAPTRAEDVYVLHSFGPGSSPSRGVKAPSKAQVSAAPVTFDDTLHVEEQGVYQPAGPDEDPFTWSYVFTDLPFTRTIDLPGLATAGGDLPLVITVRGSWDDLAVAPDHHAVLEVAGSAAGEVWFDGTELAHIETLVPAAALVAAGGLAVIAPGDTGIAWEAFEIEDLSVTYPRNKIAIDGVLALSSSPLDAVRVTGLPPGAVTVLDVTDEASPVRLLGGARVADAVAFIEKPGLFDRPDPRRYLVTAAGAEVAPASVAPLGARASSLLSLTAGADYVVVTAAELEPAAAALAGHRAAGGLATVVVDVADVEDAFAGGNHGPEALYAFLGELAASPTPPRFVVLFGAASVDPRNYLGASGPDHIAAASLREPGHDLRAWGDDQYVVDPAGRPAIALGRIPARSLDGANAYVDKVIAYEARVATEGPALRSLLVADEAAADDVAFSDLIAELAETVAYPSPAEVVDVADGVDLAHAALIDGFAAGQDVIAFAGHGNPLWWSRSRILTLDDAAALAPGRASFVLSSACYDGMFTHPDHDPLGWALVAGPADPEAGAVGVLASTTLSDPAVSAGFHKLVLDAVYHHAARTWGEAALAARAALAGIDPDAAAHVEAMAFLGDPAVAVPLPPPDIAY